MQKIKEYKKDLILFLLIFLVSLIMCSAFLKPHYTHDTYRIIYDGYEFYACDKFLRESRPFTALITLLANVVNLPIEIYMLISFIFALVFLSLSVVLIYKIFIRKFSNSNKLIGFLVMLISYITVYNYLAIEHIYFLECGILALGVLLSIVAAKTIIDNEEYKYIKAFMLILIAVFLYQGSISIFPMVVLAYKLLFQKNSIKEDFIDIVKVAIIYGICMLLSILFAWFIKEGSRITMHIDQISISNILNWLKNLVVDSLGVIPPFINIGFILVTLLAILVMAKTKIKNKVLYILKYLLIILASIAICIAPVLVGTGLALTPRMCIAYGSTIGLSLFTILNIVDKNNKKYQLIIISIITIITFILNFSLYVILTFEHLEVNKLDKANCEIIKNIVEEYEAETNIKVTKIAGVIKKNYKYYPRFIHAGAITQKALNSWASREAICYYLGRHLEYAPITSEQMHDFFGESDSEEFSTDQIVIEGDVLYFCGK